MYMEEKNFSMFVPLRTGGERRVYSRVRFTRGKRRKGIHVTRIGSIFNFACIIINIKIDRGFVATVTHDEAFQFHSTDNTAINITRYRLKFGGWKTAIGTKKKRKKSEREKKRKKKKKIIIMISGKEIHLYTRIHTLLIVITVVWTHHFANCVHKYSSITLGPVTKAGTVESVRNLSIGPARSRIDSRSKRFIRTFLNASEINIGTVEWREIFIVRIIQIG